MIILHMTKLGYKDVAYVMGFYLIGFNTLVCAFVQAGDSYGVSQTV